MEPVCKDIEANGEESFWFFAEGIYVRLAGGKQVAAITGKNLPNPVDLWRARCASLGVKFPAKSAAHPMARGQEVRLKPTDAAFALFDHWQQVNHAQPHN